MDFDLDKMYCGKIRRGGIFLYEVEDKEKAIVILQDDVLNEGLPTIVGASIEPYKKDEKIFPNEVLLKKEETGLGKDGICMLHKIITVDRGVMISKKGELKTDKLQEIYKALDINLGRFRD
ncbi:MAG: type II toxin-antitoxin system PemK/MazF family toxin [Candidatus Magasanikbacteria bacterium]|jgi:mRNA-degrading endonuclease toxin of MazEF toxin-antitoxin module|nr:type II toxin-antitoxin system PemK/MazF family toxin [Candidatus Magasanikbacteria bacterium]MBT4315243.1 type II toxin-antitoxin system PemK/MazF family toxin [Candidatus Magasanikbacteria bacterium]MBT4547111.1 type II toxin-antitoxin system PemK/MazF family toxin [Candidatus Magasanikbacteria bacterium]MBT6819119.1 type II toxin-antitoxin system PemK/MazF family toxin [Candidatus Magasanikbacteria bacterium]